MTRRDSVHYRPNPGTRLDMTRKRFGSPLAPPITRHDPERRFTTVPSQNSFRHDPERLGSLPHPPRTLLDMIRKDSNHYTVPSQNQLRHDPERLGSLPHPPRTILDMIRKDSNHYCTLPELS
ncbi:hypothetical protein RRG08_009567 [Elysia crispata]|uniref:Uncharacterized protein n=1 Tax=Elysia crispata TaxID=231223 RepID=A0AAE0ZHF2_9GAST|nr:hypothetical protein RRG08_009567 [Elysia crispata]